MALGRRMGVLLLASLCVIPAISSVAVATPYVVRGRVYCDPCRAGFETTASTILHGAKVRLECRDRNTQQLLYRDEAKTDEKGAYKMVVKEDQKNRVCDAILASSPDEGCALLDPGRDRSRVILTTYNGMLSEDRFANSMGFMTEEPLAFCAQLLLQYELNQDAV